MDNQVYFINNSWRYVKREVNLMNFTISYIQKDGYNTRDAAEKEKKIDDQKYEKDLKKIKKIANIQYTFKEYLDYWLTDIFIKGTDASTRMIGIWAVKNLIIPNIQKDVVLSYVTADYINDILRRCAPICDSAGVTAKKFLRKILFSAYAYGLMPKDIRDDLIEIKSSIPKIKLLKREELRKLLQEASKHTGYYLEILLALFVGLRSGEIRALKYSDFNKEERTVRVTRQYTHNYSIAGDDGEFSCSYYMEEKEPKADSVRLLRIPNFIFEELEVRKAFNSKIIQRVKNNADTHVDEEYVCIGLSGKRKERSALLNALKQTCNFAGVPQVSVHALRHHFATMLLEKGVPLEDISKLLGHKHITTTLDIYCGIMGADDDARAAVNTILPVEV